MKKVSVTAFCIFALAITAYGFVRPSYHLAQLISLGTNYAVLRILMAVILAIYVVLPRIRTEFIKSLMRAWGLILLGFGVTTFISPTFLGTFLNYVPLGDVFISIEGGVLALFLSMQLPAGQDAFIDPDWSIVKRKLTSGQQKLIPVVAASKTKTAQA